MVVKSKILIPMKCCLSVTKLSHNSDYYYKVKIFLINQKSFLKPLVCTLGVSVTSHRRMGRFKRIIIYLY